MTFNNYFYTSMPYYQMTTSTASLDPSNVGHFSQSLTNYNYPLNSLNSTRTTPTFGTNIRDINNGNNTNNTYYPYSSSNSPYFLQNDFIRERMQF